MKRRARPLSLRKTPAQARSRQTVNAVLEAAAQLLDREGYARLNTNAIAARAGISIGSLYQYFPNKEAICSALIRRYLGRQEAVFAGNLEDTGSTDPARQIQRTVRATIEIARQDRRGALILYKQLRNVPGERTLEQTQQAMEQELLRRYRSLRGPARFKNPDIVAFFTVRLMSLLLGQVVGERPEWLADDRLIDELSALFTGYLVRERQRLNPRL